MIEDEQLHSSERLLRAIFDGAIDAMLLADEAGHYAEANPAACALFGMSRDELLKHRVADFAAPGYRPEVAWHTFVERGHMRGKFPLLRPDGELRNLDFSAVANVLPGLHLSILRDITESQRAADELNAQLRASEARYRRIVESTSQGVWVVDAGGRTTFVNQRMADMLGYTREEMLEQTPLHFMGNAWQALGQAKLDRSRQAVAETHEHAYLRRDGSEIWVQATTNAIYDEGGRYEGQLSLISDISERRIAEQTRNHLAAIVEGSDDAIISRDVEGMIQSWNRAAEKLLQYTAQEVIGRPITILCTSERCAEREVKRGGIDAACGADHTVETAIRKDGSRVEVSVKTSSLLDSAGRVYGVSVIARDLSEQRRAAAELRHTEAQLRQAQKMEAVGSLAGGVAHDFNNLLSVILSYTTLMSDSLKPDEPMRADLQEVYRAGLRAAELTRQLLAFSRQQVLQPSVLDLNQVVLGLEKMMVRVLPEDIVLTAQPAATLGKVHADSGQIQQVLMNLVVNARDAMPEGGHLTIETSNVRLNAGAASQPDVAAGDYVMVAVTDTGTGMERHVQERIFDPFFTTKEQGKGTGLGLSTAYGIVQQSGGHLWVCSELGKGSTFEMYLPRTDRAAESVTASFSPSTSLCGHETVLLVEDEEQVRVIIRSILRKYGYTVLEAQNAGEAFLICESHPTMIHLLLTDVVMPRMSGRELAERLVPLRPQMLVLYVSGYTEHSIVHHGVLDAGIAFLQKPLIPDALLRKVREVLDAGHARTSAAAAALVTKSLDG